MRRDRKLAPAAEAAQKSAFSATRKFRCSMIEFVRCRNRNFIVGARLDRDRTLPNCRKNLAGRNSRADPFAQPEPDQTRRREYQRIVLSLIELPHTRIDVSPQILND